MWLGHLALEYDVQINQPGGSRYYAVSLTCTFCTVPFNLPAYFSYSMHNQYNDAMYSYLNSLNLKGWIYGYSILIIYFKFLMKIEDS